MPETIYQRPSDYDLEHHGDHDDVDFFRQLTRRFAPRHVLELACGSGRVTIPLARQAACDAFHVYGVDRSESMLGEAERKRAAEPESVRWRLTLARGDLRTWPSPVPMDLIVTPCSSLSHLHTIDDQLAAWRRAADNLVPGGRFVVDLTMPNLAVYAESMQTPPRAMLEIDIDTEDEAHGERMLRYKTTRYRPDEQRAEIRFLYDKFGRGHEAERYVSDFDCHVYFPREVQLLFLISGFEIEQCFGDYRFGALGPASRQMIVVGRKRLA
jgi:SAM-dependent methyltransferase